MEKTHLKMDLDEWEYLPDHGFLDFNNEDSDNKKIFSGKPCTVFNMNYFMCPSPNSQKILEPSPPPGGGGRFSRKIGACQQVVPVPIQLEPRIVKNADDADHEMTKEIILTEKISQIGPTEAGQDAVSQVFFKKMKENEFVDMKMDSPKSPRNNNNSSNMMPQLDAGAAFNSEAMVVESKSKSMKSPCSPRKIKPDSDHHNHHANSDKNQVDDEDWDQEIINNNNNEGGFDLWKWSLTGVGAICSFGVAAATVCIIVFGSQQRSKQQQQSQKLRFQIYADDKRMKQVVQQATKLNEAISAVRGVPISRAHITFGGYYDSL